MNIVYICKYISPYEGRIYELASGFSSLGHNVTIITSVSSHVHSYPSQPKFFKSRLIRPNLNLVTLQTPSYRRSNSPLRFISWFVFELFVVLFILRSRLNPDVVICSSLSLLSVISGLFVKFFYRSKFVFEVRDIWPLVLVDEGFSRFHPLVLFLSVFEYLGYSFSDLIVGTMPALSRHVFHILSRPKQVITIPMGYSPIQTLQVDSPTISHYFEPLHGKFVVGYCGSIGTSNYLEPFFQSAKLLSSNDSIHFVVVGAGDLLDYYKTEYSDLPNLTFIPKVPKSSVPSILSYFSISYISVAPSRRWLFGQSLNKLIDYMSSGLPVIASYSGYQSMINESGCGFYVPSDDVPSLIDQILYCSTLEPDDLRSLGSKGREWILSNRLYSFLASIYSSALTRL